jgi:hypothetical protein
MSIPPKIQNAYAVVGKQLLGIILASAISTFVATKTLDIRVTQLEKQSVELRGDIKDIASSTKQMAINIATLTEAVKKEYDRK